MKRMKYLLILSSVMLILVYSACKKDSNPSAADYIGNISGNYTGNFVKNGIVDQDSATAEIIQISGNEIQIHCYNGSYDTTFNMDVYYNNDSLMVCSTGSNFEETYGHPKGNNHMGDMMDGQNEWMHHMSDEHKSDDDHFGGFNMNNHSFGYIFKDGIGNTNTEIVYTGLKNI